MQRESTPFSMSRVEGAASFGVDTWFSGGENESAMEGNSTWMRRKHPNLDDSEGSLDELVLKELQTQIKSLGPKTSSCPSLLLHSP